MYLTRFGLKVIFNHNNKVMFNRKQKCLTNLGNAGDQFEKPCKLSPEVVVSEADFCERESVLTARKELKVSLREATVLHVKRREAEGDVLEELVEMALEEVTPEREVFQLRNLQQNVTIYLTTEEAIKANNKTRLK
jgi:hypothetical protein